MADDDDTGREAEADEDGPMPTVEEPDLSAAEIRILDALWDRRHRARSGGSPRLTRRRRAELR